MNNISLSCLLIAGILFGSSGYNGSSTAPVVIAGGIIKAKHSDQIEKKYKRKDCPVCKGKGWYISGDTIKKVECGYCEPDQGQNIQTEVIPAPPPPNCKNGKCPIRR